MNNYLPASPRPTLLALTLAALALAALFASRPPATAAAGPVQTSIEAVALTSDQTVAPSLLTGQRSDPDPAKLSTTFKRTDDIVVLAKLSPAANRVDRGAWVDLLVSGPVGPPSHTVFVARPGGWSFVFLPNPYLPGEYSLTATVVGTSSSKATKFIISGTPATGLKFGDAILVPNMSIATYDKANLQVATFAAKAQTAFEPSQTISALFSVEPQTPVAATAVTATWRYNGKDLGTTQADSPPFQGAVRIAGISRNEHPPIDPHELGVLHCEQDVHACLR